MAKLHEYQGKQILQMFKIPVPRGKLITGPGEITQMQEWFESDVVIKGQAWVTGRAGKGLIKFATNREEAAAAAADMLGREVGSHAIEHVLVEEKLPVEREFYAGLIIDDVSQSPVLIFSSIGGSGIEQISQEHPEAIAKRVIQVQTGLKEYQARDLVRQTGIRGKLQGHLADILVKLYQAARKYHARAAEINPIVLLTDGRLMAADCRITVDDNAVYLFPELGIEVAREFDRPPTRLEKIAWNVEKNDYRGTFFFIQMEKVYEKNTGFIGFHGAGGGGSMMSMDAVMNQGFHIANFVDTSGNPPASKVYRAARIILSQPNIDGYFSSGSGVASQEQFHSARGLVKAFMEHPLTVPAVIRLGGNAEETAIRIIERAQLVLQAPVEAYGKKDTPDFCASRLKALIAEPAQSEPKQASEKRIEHHSSYCFSTVTGGTVSYDYERCRQCESKVCINTCVSKILKLEDGVPVLSISVEDAKKGKCSECLACEVECFFEGNAGGKITLPISGLEDKSCRS